MENFEAFIPDPVAEVLLHNPANGDRVYIQATSVRAAASAALALGGDVRVVEARPPELRTLIEEGVEISRTGNM